MAIQEAFVGDGGTLLKYSNETVHVPNCPHTGCPPTCPPPPPHVVEDNCVYANWMVWKKQLQLPHSAAGSGGGSGGSGGDSSEGGGGGGGGGGKVALLLINNANEPQDVSVDWSDLPSSVLRCPSSQQQKLGGSSSSGGGGGGGGGCAVRDVYTRKDLGQFASGFTAKALPPHGSAFIVVSG